MNEEKFYHGIEYVTTKSPRGQWITYIFTKPNNVGFLRKFRRRDMDVFFGVCKMPGFHFKERCIVVRSIHERLDHTEALVKSFILKLKLFDIYIEDFDKWKNYKRTAQQLHFFIVGCYVNKKHPTSMRGSIW